MTSESMLESYAELAVRVALNLQPGQRLLILGPLMNGGVSLDAAPLGRHIAAAPYRAGALQQATSRSVMAFRELISRNHTNWAVIAAASPAWAAKVFPDGGPDEQ